MEKKKYLLQENPQSTEKSNLRHFRASTGLLRNELNISWYSTCPLKYQSNKIEYCNFDESPDSSRGGFIINSYIVQDDKIVRGFNNFIKSL